ncbi:MAG: Hsp70 family protein [Saprospiraceae bacterium]
MATYSINLKDGNIDKPTETIVGIDLGTTNSLVAYIQEGNPVCVMDKEGDSSLVPSVVHFGDNQSVLVGDEAKEKLISDPVNTIFSVKRLMGKSFKDISGQTKYFGYQILDDDKDALVKIKVKEKFYTPIELSSLILKELKRKVEGELNTVVQKAVITVPAYFNDNQRQATRDAGKLAGLDVLRIVNEPTAAALAYNPQGEGATAVYDLGGGTFDISILEIRDGIFEVLSTNGDTYLGGDDFDREIIHYWLETLGLDHDQLEKDKAFGQEIRLAAEKAKKALSSSSEFETSIQGKKVSISRAKFEELITPFIEKTINCCKNAIKDAGLQVSDIGNVILVGGSTRVPLVKGTVKTSSNRMYTTTSILMRW